MLGLILIMACAPDSQIEAPADNDRFESDAPLNEVTDDPSPAQTGDEDPAEETPGETLDDELGYTEVGDCTFHVQEEGEDYVDMRGAFCTPSTIYGELDSAGNDGETYTGDVDYLLVQPPHNGTFQIALHWTAEGSDYDLSVMDANTLDVLDHSYYDEPELVEMTLYADTAYYLVIGGWDGEAGSWTLEIDWIY